MRISMHADFRILKRSDNGCYVPLNKSEAVSVSVGGYEFDIGSYSVPFDWDAFAGVEEEGIFRFSTGQGATFNDYELAEYYDKQYREMGFERKDITASFLASAHHIEEFSVCFTTRASFENNYDEIQIGFYDNNGGTNVDYKLELLRLGFEDLETLERFDVAQRVLECFNRGEPGLMLSEVPVAVEIMDVLVAANKMRMNRDAVGLDSQIARCIPCEKEHKHESRVAVDRDDR